MKLIDVPQAWQRFRHKHIGGTAPSPSYGPIGKPDENGEVVLGSIRARTLPPLAEDTDSILRETAPRLPKPVILLHGMGQKADTWFNVKNFLCSHPANKFGAVFHGDREEQFLQRCRDNPGGRVFGIDLSSNIVPAPQVADELHRCEQLVKQMTGEDPWIITHSMGAIVARECKRRHPESIQNVIMLAPPNHGSGDADVAVSLHRMKVYSHYPANHMSVLKSLRSQKDVLGRPSNAYLEGLDRDWQNPAYRFNCYIITGAGVPTPGPGGRTMKSGDGMVIPESAHLPHAEFYIAQAHDIPPESPQFRDFEDMRYNHLNIVSDCTAMHKMVEIMTRNSAAEDKQLSLPLVTPQTP